MSLKQNDSWQENKKELEEERLLSEHKLALLRGIMADFPLEEKAHVIHEGLGIDTSYLIQELTKLI